MVLTAEPIGGNGFQYLLVYTKISACVHVKDQILGGIEQCYLARKALYDGNMACLTDEICDIPVAITSRGKQAGQGELVLLEIQKSFLFMIYAPC